MALPEVPGGQTPRQNIAITKDAKRMVCIDVAPLLRLRCVPLNDSLLGEELKEITAVVRDTDDVLVTGVTDDSKTRVIPCEQGRGSIIALEVDGTAAGLSDGSDYVLSISVLTSEGQILNPRIGLRCIDVRPR